MNSTYQILVSLRNSIIVKIAICSNEHFVTLKLTTVYNEENIAAK